MEKKNIDWQNLGFAYLETDQRYVSNYKDGAWDEGTMTSDPMLSSMNAPAFCNTPRPALRGSRPTRPRMAGSFASAPTSTPSG